MTIDLSREEYELIKKVREAPKHSDIRIEKRPKMSGYTLTRIVVEANYLIGDLIVGKKDESMV